MAWKKVWLMKRKRKRSVMYDARWYGEDGRMHSMCVGPDKKLAEEWKRRKEYEINSPDYEEIRRVAVADYCKEYAEFKSGKIAPASIEMTVWFMHKFSEVTGVKCPSVYPAKGWPASRFRQNRLERLASEPGPWDLVLQYYEMRGSMRAWTRLLC